MYAAPFENSTEIDRSRQTTLFAEPPTPAETGPVPSLPRAGRKVVVHKSGNICLSPHCTNHGYSKRYDEQCGTLEKQARKEGLEIWGDPELTRKYLRLKSKWGQAASPPK